VKGQAPQLPTVKAAVAYGLKLQTEAFGLTSADPYASPWYPTTASVYELVRRCKGRLVAEATARATAEDPPRELTESELEAIAAQAPQAAIEHMRFKAAQRRRREAESNETSQRSEARLARQHDRANRDRDAMRRGQSLGHRLDCALAALSTVAGPAAARTDSEPITGGQDEGLGPAFVEDAAGRSRQRAHGLVYAVEEELARMTRRRLDRAA